MQDVIIGIDPGSKGALCINNTKKGVITFLRFDQVSIFTIYNELEKIADSVKFAVIEEVHAIYGSSAKSTFTFGYNLGSIETVIMCLGIPIHRVAPKNWHKLIGVKVEKGIIGAKRKRKIKESVSKRCEELYPKINVKGPKGGLLDGVSDSLLIAHYGHMKLN